MDADEGFFDDNDMIEETIPGEVDIHTSLPTQAGVERIITDEVPVKHTIEATGPMEFTITSGEVQAIIPSSIHLHLTVQLRKGGQVFSAIDPQTNAVIPENCVIPVNQLGTALFKDLEIKVNNNKIGKTDGLYHYRADLTTRLDFSEDEKKQLHSLAGYYPSDHKFSDIANMVKMKELIAFEKKTRKDILSHSGGNEGYNSRYAQVYNSREWEIITPLFGEFFQQHKILPPKTTLTLTLTRNEPKFALLSKEGSDFSIVITKAYLLVDKLEMEPQFSKEIEFETYSGNKGKYPQHRKELTTFSRNPGMRDHSIGEILVGKVLPRRIFIALVSSDGYHGDYKADPFYYEHFNVQELNLIINGSMARTRPIKCDYEEDKFKLALDSLNRAVGIKKGEENIGINERNYLDGNVIYGFDVNGLATTLTNSFLKEEQGTVGLNLLLKKNNTKGFFILVFAEYDSEIDLDKDGTTNYEEFA